MEFLTQVRLAGLYSRAVLFLALTFLLYSVTDTLLAFLNYVFMCVRCPQAMAHLWGSENSLTC